MKQQFVKMILFITSVFFLISCGKDKSLTGPPGPYFWKAQKDGKASYFLGTFHIANTMEDLQCSGKIKSALENSNLLFTEVDAHSKEHQAFLTKLTEFLKKAMQSENGHEFKTLNEESQIFFRSRTLPENLSYTGYTIQVDGLCLNQVKVQSGAGAVSLDSQLRAISQANNIPVAYLDEGMDVDKLLQAFIDVTYDSDANSETVNKAVANFESCISEAKEAYDSYRKGALIDAIIGEINGWGDEQKKAMLKDRNERWVAKFKEAHKSGNYNQIFLAGGTAHFIADFNVLDMLKKEGFSISRMNVNCEY